METWLIVLIVVVVVAAALVALAAARRTRSHGEADAIGLPPIGAISGDGTPGVEPGVDPRESTDPRRVASDRPVR